ncbi:hypothetical protein KFE25_004993 [Diacronema lutheri]|uniref:Sulfotransferase n=2 Tax=Diacronema lutheri TaxID=2081491 RepID=A0A8J5XGH8_DIALT|nr:hypothetical protein KFE25_004993 [Diacronema lutheri]
MEGPNWVSMSVACLVAVLSDSARAQPSPSAPASGAGVGGRERNVSLARPACRWDGAPIWWLHAPKTASTFCNIVVRAACPGIQLRAQLREPNTKLLREANCAQHGKIALLRPGHRPLPSNFKGQKVAVVSLFRDPVARVASGYFHNLHDCRRLQRKHGFNEWDDVGLFSNAPARERVFGPTGVRIPVLLEYASCVSACHTRMLLNGGCGYERGALGASLRNDSHAPPLETLPRESQRLIRSAVRMVRDRLSFVGVTELFRESVHAFGTFAGVPVVSALDFGNTRPSWANRAQKEAAEGALRNALLVDSFVYAAAQERLAAFQRQCENG